MPSVGYVMERVRLRAQLTSVEAAALGEEIARLVTKLEGCAQEVARRDEAEQEKRQQTRELAHRAQTGEEEVARLRESLEHARQQRESETNLLRERTTLLESVLRDAHQALTNDEHMTREQVAQSIAAVVEPYP